MYVPRKNPASTRDLLSIYWQNEDLKHASFQNIRLQHPHAFSLDLLSEYRLSCLRSLVVLLSTSPKTWVQYHFLILCTQLFAVLRLFFFCVRGTKFPRFLEGPRNSRPREDNMKHVPHRALTDVGCHLARCYRSGNLPMEFVYTWCELLMTSLDKSPIN